MTQQLIQTTPSNTGFGSSPKAAFDICNANFSDLYGSIPGSGGAASIVYNPPFTSSVPETISAKLAQTVSVLDFGADPAGVADSTAAINLAIAWVHAAGGGSILYPPGSYLVGSAGVFVNYVFGSITHVGVSREGAVIVNGSTNQPAIQCGDGSTQIFGGGIKNIRFTQKASVAAVTGNAAFVYSLVGQFSIENVFVSNALGAPFRGAQFTGTASGCSQFVIYNLQVQGCLSDGITNIGGVDVYATDSRSDANGGSGWQLNASQGGYYKSCTGFNNTVDGWNLLSGSPSTAPNKNNFFDQCIGDTSGNHNWQIRDSQDSTWVACWGSTQQSITVNTSASGFFIVTSACKRLTLTNCLALNNNAHGFQVFDNGTAPTAISFHNCQGTVNGVAAGGGNGLVFNGNTNQIRVNGGNYAGNVTSSVLNQSGLTDITVSGNPIGFVSNNQGTGIVTTTATSVVITHGLGFTPNLTNIQITPTSSLAASGITSYWTSTPTSTQFTLNTNAAVAGSSFNFVWRAGYNGT